MRTSSVDTSRTSSNIGILRDTTTSAMRSTKVDLFTVYGMLVMFTVFVVLPVSASSHVPRTFSEPWPVS